jgi:predicted ArsR family transcriptional regulator
MVPDAQLRQLDIALDRDLFLRTLIRELAGVLEDVVGYEEAAGYISLVGQKVGAWLNALYLAALGVERLSRSQVAEVLVDLKQRIQGDFSLLCQDEEKIELISASCPFAEQAIGRPSMCMMTSNVFGVIAARNLGYAKVVLHETIAGRSPCCRVTVFLAQSPESFLVPGREYFGE